MQVQLSTQQAALSAITAEHALMLALLELQAGTLVTLEGWGVR
jgi:hypothetical protein